MRKTVIIILAVTASMLSACSILPEDPYAKTISALSVQAVYPESFSARAGVVVKIQEINLGNSYESNTDASGLAKFNVPQGLYRIIISDRYKDDIFQGNSDKVSVRETCSVKVSLKHSKKGSIVIKEIYCGGCKKAPLEGNYGADQYMILHNNDTETQYLDSLCFGVLYPFNSNATNPWVTKDPVTGESVFQDFIPLAQCIWQFPGDGTKFPLKPGQDAVIAINGGIDHSAQYPLSVNLNKEDYFVCHNTTYFPNPNYHPAPGNKISQSRILNVVIKTGQANAYTFSLNSPAVAIFKAKGRTIQAFVGESGSIRQTPGDSHNPVVAIPRGWVMDAVEVYNGSSSTNSKRFSPELDAGYIKLSGTYLAHSLMRHKDFDLSESSGYEVLCDSNNSLEDFYETDKQSLHE